MLKKYTENTANNCNAEVTLEFQLFSESEVAASAGLHHMEQRQE